jgi:acyl-CoA reductase-like NAD-dependent aldehyde dehydrogenase
VNARHRERLRALLKEANDAGERVEEINPAGEDLAATPRIAPHLVVTPRSALRLMREEIFGPILPIVAYRELGDAIAYVNARARPLALYVFDRDAGTVARVVDETVSGGVTVNETFLHIAQEDLPFGGVGESGMGQYHGRAGFETFSRAKPVFHQPRLNLLGLFRPPYGPRFERLMRLLSR